MMRGPRQPQCLSSVKASMPWMSAAGFARVNVTHRKLRSDSATNWESSVRRRRRKGEWGRGKADVVGCEYEGALMARTPGRMIRGSLNPGGSWKSDGKVAANSNRGGPTAAIMTLEPALRPVPE